MPSDKDIGEEARELLANAAHGPLELIRYEHGGGRLYRTEPHDLIADFYDAGNRELYYRAPELLRALANEVEQLRKIAEDALRFRIEMNGPCDHDDYMIRLCTQCEIRAALQMDKEGHRDHKS